MTLMTQNASRESEFVVPLEALYPPISLTFVLFHVDSHRVRGIPKHGRKSRDQKTKFQHRATPNISFSHTLSSTTAIP